MDQVAALAALGASALDDELSLDAEDLAPDSVLVLELEELSPSELLFVTDLSLELLFELELP